jgi:hypothetical protein
MAQWLATRAVAGDVLVTDAVKDFIAGAGIEIAPSDLSVPAGVPAAVQVFAVR